MADGAVGDQTLYIRLADGGDSAQHHREHGDDDDDLPPLVRSREGVMRPKEQGDGRDLRAAAKKAVTGVGEPSYTSGVHMWNGTAPTLKREPSDEEHKSEDESKTAGCRNRRDPRKLGCQ